MADPASEISPQRRAFGQALRDLRLASGLNQDQVAGLADRSQAAISRYETGKFVPSNDDLDAYLRAVSADQATCAALVERAAQVRTEATEWRRLFAQGYGRKQQAIEDLERESKAIYNFAPLIVPGVLQTAEYAGQAFQVWNPEASDADVADYMDGRVGRQRLLYDRSRAWVFIVTEGALRWRPGPVEALRAQLGQVRSLATLANVELGIVPFAILAPTLFMHSFVLYERDDGTTVTIETYTDELDVQDPVKIQVYRDVLDRLRGGALWGDDALAFLDEVMREMEDA